MAMTGNGAILLFSHSPSVIAFSSVRPSQAMRAADREPAGGEILVVLVAASRLMISRQQAGVSRTNRLALI